MRKPTAWEALGLYFAYIKCGIIFEAVDLGGDSPLYFTNCQIVEKNTRRV